MQEFVNTYPFWWFGFLVLTVGVLVFVVRLCALICSCRSPSPQREQSLDIGRGEWDSLPRSEAPPKPPPKSQSGTGIDTQRGEKKEVPWS